MYSNLTLSEAIKLYKLDKEFQFSPDTKRSCELRLAILLDFLGDVEIASITKVNIREFLTRIRSERKLSDRSIYDYYTTCSSLWTWAQEELKIDHVVKQIPRPKFTKKTIGYFDKDDVTAILECLDHTREYTHGMNGQTVRNRRDTRHRDRAIVMVLLDSGLRISELGALKIEDYDKRRGLLFVAHGKGDKERNVPVGESTKAAITKYMESRFGAKPTEPLFANRRGDHLKRGATGKILRDIGHRAGVRKVHAHRFRHTFAITFLRNGGNVLELQAIMGHEDIEPLKEYVRLATVDIEAAHKKYSPADNWKL